MKKTYKKNPSLMDIFNQNRTAIIGGAVLLGGCFWFWKEVKKVEKENDEREQQAVVYNDSEAKVKVAPTYVKPTIIGTGTPARITEVER